MSSDSTVDDEHLQGDGEITLEMLHAVEHDERLSQRSLAASLNIALGLTNAYLKRCVGRGWVKVQKIPPNRYAYYLTPKGFSEKTRLTARYLSSSFSFYRRARNQCDALLQEAVDNGHRRIALAGSGELAEIAILCALQYNIDIAGVIEPEMQANRFRHVDMVRDTRSLEGIDAVLVCDLKAPQDTFDRLSTEFDAGRILTPTLLKVSRRAPGAAAGDAQSATETES